MLLVQMPGEGQGLKRSTTLGTAERAELARPFQKTAGEERNQVSFTYQAQSVMVKQVNVLEVKIQYPKQARRNDLQFWR